ncbi:MAG: asparagine synthase-related protein [Actinomycetota bacterium]|nr:asparagine synthase-related protein [Actinomycetota bacterium]
MSQPSRKSACGAIGPYDRETVQAIAARMDVPVALAHEDPGSILLADREPIRWEAAEQRGFGWSERVDEVGGGGIASWRDAACAGAACGLVVGARGAHLHTSVAGVAPLYFLAHEGAAYFATSVDALAGASPRPLSVDWEAWAAILAIDHPLGDRTPFAEIRRLPPFSTLEVRAHEPVVVEESWPWAEVEPRHEVAAGVEAVVERLRASVASLPPGPIVCQLSGGLDSRLCLGLLGEHRGADVTTLTVDPDSGTDQEMRIAARVAETAGVPHTAVTGDPADYLQDLVLRARRVDYQAVRPPWRIPEIAALKEAGGTVVDGFGFDVLAVPGDRFFFAGAVEPHGEDSVVESVWRVIRARHDRRTLGMLRGGLGSELWSSAERQFMGESERFRGHPARAILTFYRTRELRGVSLAPYGVLGADVPLAMPLIDHELALATLAVMPPAKRGGKLYDAAFERISPRLLSLGTSRRGGNFAGERIPRRSRSEAVADALHADVAGGPLAPWVRPGVLRRLSRHHRGKRPGGIRGALGIAMFHQWCERYRGALGEVDPAAGFGVPRPRERAD